MFTKTTSNGMLTKRFLQRLALPTRQKWLSSVAAQTDSQIPKDQPVEKNRKLLKDGNKTFKVDPQNVHNAFGLMKSRAWARFNETVEVAVNLSVDPRKPNQSVKGVAQLPNGTGKSRRIAVFASGIASQSCYFC